MVGKCGICWRPYRMQEQHTKDSHRKQVWEYFKVEHPMPHGYCTICGKSVQESIRNHVMKKHLGMAVRGFVRAGLLK